MARLADMKQVQTVIITILVRAYLAWRWMRAHQRGLQPVILFLIGLVGLTVLVQWGTLWLDDLRYGRPRTMQVSAFVGHQEQPGNPSHFVALNLNRQVVVLELRGGDSTKTQVLQGPTLFGVNEELTPVTLRVVRVNQDDKPDLVLSIKREEIIYINTGDTFRLITDDERRQLMLADP